MIGKIVKIISNTCIIESNGNEYETVIRGKLKLEEIKPTVRGQCRI